MYKVEIKSVRYFGQKKKISVIDTYYFNGENEDVDSAYNQALKFIRRYNKNMPFYENGYDVAWKPVRCYSFPLSKIILETLEFLRKNESLEYHFNNKLWNK